MVHFSKLKNSFLKVGKPLKQAKWLIPGWVFYEFYNVYKNQGNTRGNSLKHGAKAEAMRLAALASVPLPGTYELTTTGLAVLKNKIESGEIEKFNLKAFKDFTPLGKINLNRHKNFKGKPYLRIYFGNKKIYFKIFYKYK